MSNMTLQRDAYLRQHKPTLERHGDDRPYNNNTWQSCAGRKFPISLCTSAVTLPPLSSFLNSKRSAPCSQSPGASTDEKDRFAAWFANEATKFDAATNDSQAAQICATVLPDAHFSSYLTLRPFCGPRMPQVGLHCGGLTSRDRGTSVRNGKITKKRRPSEGTKAPNVNIAFQQLRTLIPTEPVDRRLSKVETLRLAVSYIHHLGQTLNADVQDELPCMPGGSGTNEISGSICTFCMSKKRKMAIT